MAGALTGWWSRDRLRERRLGELEADARRCALAFQLAEVRALTGDRGDEATEVYRAVKERLIELQCEMRDALALLAGTEMAASAGRWLGVGALPAKADSFQPVKGIADRFGRQVVLMNGLREQVGTQTTTISASWPRSTWCN